MRPRRRGSPLPTCPALLGSSCGTNCRQRGSRRLSAAPIYDFYFWFDVFVNSQHGVVDRPFAWWRDAFVASIRQLGHTLIVLAPWAAPIYASRAWCLFELFASVRADVDVTIALPPAQRKAFIAHVKESGANIFFFFVRGWS